MTGSPKTGGRRSAADLVAVAEESQLAAERGSLVRMGRQSVVHAWSGR